MDSFRRKTPEEILRSIMEIHRGRLKVYIGAVSGTGKTYHMLLEGHTLKQQGVDVVICAVSTMQRPETVEQVGDLERVPSIHWTEDGMERKDLNLDELIARNPEVVLVDGLAHRNRKGARFATRLEDIDFLLAKGISVVTTVNVYELEEMKEFARKLVGVQVKNTVPASVLQRADEVRLIDVSPQTLLNRLAEGHLKDSDSTLFKQGSLNVLRELALRLMADDVNFSLERHREEMGLIGPSGVAERILVSAQYHWNGSLYIRRGQQIAKRLNGELLIVTFSNRREALTKEVEAFRRSMIKLADKVGAHLEELPFGARRHIPNRLVRYAISRKVTRIVLGHSKQTLWQELIHGSIARAILRKIKNVDVFLMADRAEHQGERILPTKSSSKVKDTAAYRRLSVEEKDEKIERIRRGRFKVYIGAAPGVGKTYTMLREGNVLMKKGIDVAVGLLETHGRKETSMQLGDLQLIPRRSIEYKETRLEEMDVPAILARNPELVLVDELAHTNVPGSKNKKRYEDIVEILEAGISVISTVNVQHLESLNDAVAQITGVRVRETVPDSILRLADEVELIDVTPQSLQQRLKEGKVYAMEKVDQALNHFFKTGNLIALRELALREIADDVDERLEAWEERSSLRGPLARQEVIFVGVTTGANAERLIRRGFRISHRLKAPWYVVSIHGPIPLTDEARRRSEELRKLTVRLGGTFEWVDSSSFREVPRILLAKADEHRATQIIVGQPNRSLWETLRNGSVITPLLRSARHMDVLVVADFDPDFRPQG